MVDILKAVILIGTVSSTIGNVCVFNEESKIGVVFNLLGNPSNTTVGCKCPASHKHQCSRTEKEQFDKLQQYMPDPKPGVTECCFSMAHPIQHSVEKDTDIYEAESDDSNFKVTCIKESVEGWSGHLIRGFEAHDNEEDITWNCNCHHFRIKEFWLCYDEECGRDCQNRMYDRLQPVTGECCDK